MTPPRGFRRLPIARAEAPLAPRCDITAALGPGRGVVVVGHGTADPVGAEETRAVGRMVATVLPGVPVEVGFLEVIGPSIGEAVARLAARGCREAVAAPLLLFTAGHARHDIPAALEAAGHAAGVVLRQASPLGCHPAIVALARRRRREAVRGLEPVAAEAAALVMIGRGSSDPLAPRQLLEFTAATLAPAADACPHDPDCRRFGLGFVAAARPSVREALAASAAVEGTRRVIVQPHLLFHGHVEEQVDAAVVQARHEHPEIEWIVASRLGADPDVVAAVVDRVADLACGTPED